MRAAAEIQRILQINNLWVPRSLRVKPCWSWFGTINALACINITSREYQMGSKVSNLFKNEFINVEKNYFIYIFWVIFIQNIRLIIK